MSRAKGVSRIRQQFLAKLQPVKDRLPKNYGVFYRKEFGDDDRKKVYNVYNGICMDNDILDNLKKIAKKYGTKANDVKA